MYRVPSSFSKYPKDYKSTTHLFQAAPVQPVDNQDSDDGVDLFGSDDEEESAEAAKIREERLAAYNAKKAKSML